MATKYWIAGNPNAEVSDAEVVELKTLGESLEVGVVDSKAGAASAGHSAKATKVLKVSVNGVDHYIPCYTANVAP